VCLIDNSTVVTNNHDNIHVQWRAIGHNAPLCVYTQLRFVYTRVSFPLLQCTCQPITINWVVALQLVAWALLGNHSSTITIACGCSKSTYFGCNRYSCLWSKHTVFVITVLLLDIKYVKYWVKQLTQQHLQLTQILGATNPLDTTHNFSPCCQCVIMSLSCHTALLCRANQ